MNKIIPFNKEITFDDVIGEITSIALDDNLLFSDSYTISGDLTVRGTNKVGDITKDFSYSLPVLISVDSKYDTKDAKISVDDFYYEIINETILRVKIDLVLDNLVYVEEEKEEKIEEILIDDLSRDEVKESDKGKSLNLNFDLEKQDDDLKIKTNLSGEIKNEQKEINTDNLADILPETKDEKEYSIYRVYTVLDNDTLDSILNKYKVKKEDIEPYNDLSNVKVGTKLIIPSVDE